MEPATGHFEEAMNADDLLSQQTHCQNVSQGSTLPAMGSTRAADTDGRVAKSPSGLDILLVSGKNFLPAVRSQS